MSTAEDFYGQGPLPLQWRILMDKIIAAILAVIGVIVLAAAISLLMAFPISWCWNYAVVATFGLPKITWGMAWCINFLCHLFFKSTKTVSKS